MPESGILLDARTMKFTFLTYGTEGDTRPLVALAHALAARGHAVRLLADAATAGSAHTHGVDFTPLAGSMKDALAPGGALAEVVAGKGGAGTLARAFAESARDQTVAWMRTAAEAAQGGDVLVFSGLASYAGLAVAEGLDLPCVGAGLWPMTPTGDFASLFLRTPRLPRWANRLSHHAVGRLSWSLFRPAINEGRQAVFGKAPRSRMWQGYPILYGCSPSLLPRPRDWAPEVELCGAWHLPQPAWSPPPALGRFLDDGEPPLYIGFGSMAGFDRDALLRALTGAVGTRRALFQPGWSGIDTARLPSNFFVIGDTPHDWLFPRCALVVHHGGAGTAHAAARAGVPSVILPFAGDQFFWARRLEELGAASCSDDAAHLDAGQLAQLIAQASGPACRANALAVAQRLQGEDGVGAACTRLEAGVAARLRP